MAEQIMTKPSSGSGNAVWVYSLAFGL